MSAHLSHLFGTELEVTEWQQRRYLEAYLERLSRYQFYVAAAYIRKNVTHAEITELTQMETTFYTSCGRCGKAIESSASSKPPGEIPDGGFAFCPNCRRLASQCSICQLPVRGLLLHCVVCSHGGHQSCYRDFYAALPSLLDPTPPPDPPLTARPTPTHRSSGLTGSIPSTSYSDHYPPPPPRIYEPRSAPIGKPCPAGCGHNCFSENEMALAALP